MNNSISFICNNVKGIQNTEKRIKIFEYLKSYVTHNGFIFLQETHSTVNDEKQWEDEFKGKLFYSHGKSNSCGVAIGFFGTKVIEIIKKISDVSGRILILEIKLDDTIFVLVNLYNANIEKEQLETLAVLLRLLNKIDDIHSKNIILGGDFNVFFNPNLEAQGGNPVIKKNLWQN